MKLKQILPLVYAVFAGAIVFFLFGVVCPVACTQPEKATRALKSAGYKSVEITGWRPFSKGEDDLFSTGFRAIAPNGEEITGTVTSGAFKGNTIRTD